MKNHNLYVAGVPDVWYSGRKDLWVEYKFVPVKKPRTVVIPDLSLQQQHWIAHRLEEGRSIWVIVGYKPGGVIFETLDEMLNGIQPEAFQERTLSRADLAQRIANHCNQEPRINETTQYSTEQHA